MRAAIGTTKYFLGIFLGQSEPAATNAPMGCGFSFDVRWGSSLLPADHCTFFFFWGLFLVVFSMDLISHIATLFFFLLS
jgi:hypothetical protein